MAAAPPTIHFHGNPPPIMDAGGGGSAGLVVVVVVGAVGAVGAATGGSWRMLKPFVSSVEID